MLRRTGSAGRARMHHEPLIMLVSDSHHHEHIAAGLTEVDIEPEHKLVGVSLIGSFDAAAPDLLLGLVDPLWLVLGLHEWASGRGGIRASGRVLVRRVSHPSQLCLCNMPALLMCTAVGATCCAVRTPPLDHRVVVVQRQLQHVPVVCLELAGLHVISLVPLWHEHVRGVPLVVRPLLVEGGRWAGHLVLAWGLLDLEPLSWAVIFT
jgi:hypothetical protein